MIKMYQKFLKRLFDLLASACALIVLSPVLFYLAYLIKNKLGSPVIFTQIRPGKDCKLFKMYKFRSMTNEVDENGNLLSDEKRLNNFGKKLRATSLDELPELINILKGDMSIVGPRPQLVRDMVFFSNKEMKRQTVYPGLTGLAQISGRNNISWEEKFKYDLQYIQNISFLEDLKIIFRTVFKVTDQEGINTDGMETAEDLGDYLLRTKKISLKDYKEKIKQAENLLKGAVKQK